MCERRHCERVSLMRLAESEHTPRLARWRMRELDKLGKGKLMSVLVPSQGS